MSKTIGFYTLGCKVNQYESEACAEEAERRGFTVLPPTERCDVYVINTCTVTGESDRKSRQFIRRAISQNPDAKIIVMGCMAQVSPDDARSIEGVDAVIGTKDKLSCVKIAEELLAADRKKIIDKVESLDLCPFESMNITHFPRTRAYIKIEDGCESKCAYCIIPAARGKIRSKPPKEVLSEIELLKAKGCREVVLTGIETSAYGVDLGDYRLADLLCDVDKIAGDSMRVRLGSLDPSLIRPEFVEKISKLGSIAPHFHLSLQSGSSSVLALMKRRYNADMAMNAVRLLREAFPDVQLTSDFIVGFPGETEEYFNETCKFVKEARLLNSHIFPYSKRKGTPAAVMTGQLPQTVKFERVKLLSDVQAAVTEEILKKEVGKTYDVLFETSKNGKFFGHTASFIEVSVKSEENLHAETKKVKITGCSDGVADGIII